MMTKIRFVGFFFAALMLSATVIRAQTDCPSFVQTTIQTVDQVCDQLGRDQACYGNENLEATGRNSDFSFSTPGDVTDVADIDSLRLASMQLEEQVWGVVMMQLRANVPTTTSESTPQNITLVLFGDVSITNQVPPLVELDALINADTQVYVRPNDSEPSIAVLTTGASVTANGRLENSTWIRIALADESYGWVRASELQITGDVSTLIAADAQGEVYGPMQAFFMQTGDSERPCAQAPADGVLIQTPEGMGEINFLINEVDVRLGSTAFLATHEQALNIAVLEGHGEITADGETVIVEGGTYTSIPLDEDGMADGEPSEVEEYEDVALEELPVEWLPDEVEVDVEDGEATDEPFIDDLPDTRDDDDLITPEAPEEFIYPSEEPSDPPDEPSDPPEEPAP